MTYFITGGLYFLIPFTFLPIPPTFFFYLISQCYIDYGNRAACWRLTKISVKIIDTTDLHFPKPLRSCGLREMSYHLIIKSSYTTILEKIWEREARCQSKKNILNHPLIFFLYVCSFVL